MVAAGPSALNTPLRAGAADARATGAVCVVLHDVCPAHWAACRRVLAAVEACALSAGVRLPVTLLVVPHLHGDPALPREYLQWLRQLAAQGHELVLHGLTHRDDGPPPRRVGAWLLRRHYTAGEGEFAALPPSQALQRMQAGRHWARAHRLPMRGFVPPAWLMGPGTLGAACEAGFRHTCTLNRIIALPQGRSLHAPSFVFSTRSAWRRVLSVAWNRLLAWRLGVLPLQRLELHPHDADHTAVRRCWESLLRQALRYRTPLRLGEAAELARRHGQDPVGAAGQTGWRARGAVR